MNKSMSVAQAYYTAMGLKDLTAVASFLHSDVTFKAPLASCAGKEKVLSSIESFMKMFNTLLIVACCGFQDQAMLVYELDFPAPINKMRSAAFLTLQEGLITKIELFYDARPFERK